MDDVDIGIYRRGHLGMFGIDYLADGSLKMNPQVGLWCTFHVHVVIIYVLCTDV